MDVAFHYIGGIGAALLGGYLLYVLLRPEDFS